ncbi:MAG TPA: ribosome maturation factor RimP [Peptococcaceae bacterium]|nr:ribosome maturation factor RimP [Peptococcaceae bacterium]
MSSKLLDQMLEEAEPKVEALGYELVDLELVKEGANWYLRFYIDKEGVVDLDDCQKVSEMISDWLDEEDPIPQAYFLEVSSPGIERVLRREKDFLKYAGSVVAVKLFGPWQGKKQYEGTLGPVTADHLTITDAQGQVLEIPRDMVSRVNLAWIDIKEG